MLEYAYMLDVQLPPHRRLVRSAVRRTIASVAMGAFEGERIDLIGGVLVTISPNDPQHASPVQVLKELLLPAQLRVDPDAHGVRRVALESLDHLVEA